MFTIEKLFGSRRKKMVPIPKKIVNGLYVNTYMRCLVVYPQDECINKLREVCDLCPLPVRIVCDDSQLLRESVERINCGCKLSQGERRVRRLNRAHAAAEYLRYNGFQALSVIQDKEDKVIGGLTERQAIAISMEMWLWLSQNPTKTKVDFPDRSKYGIGNMLSECPCCQYYRSEIRYHTNECPECPLNQIEYCANTRILPTWMTSGLKYAYAQWDGIVKGDCMPVQDQVRASNLAWILYEKLRSYYQDKFVAPPHKNEEKTKPAERATGDK
jgi:hypothetical protein